MRKAMCFLCLCAVVLGSIVVVAQDAAPARKRAHDELPYIVLTGLQSYKDHGPDEAVRSWIKNGPLEGSREVMTQANNLRQVQDFYGLYRGFDVVTTVDLSARTRVVYLILNFERGPLFAKFVVYRTEQAWVVVSFDFNTKETQIFPNDMSFGER